MLALSIAVAAVLVFHDRSAGGCQFFDDRRCVHAQFTDGTLGAVVKYVISAAHTRDRLFRFQISLTQGIPVGRPHTIRFSKC